MQNTHTTPSPAILTVAEVNRQARLLLETGFPGVCISGELSNLSRPSSGHWYFSLKDAHAQIRCAMFRHRNQGLNLKITDGMQLLAKGKISLYEGRGDYQLIVDAIEPYGDGLLTQQFEQLKQALQALGWFDAKHKRPLPSHPRTIGVVSSATGAAITDILHVLKRRMPSIPVIVYPTQVQGKQSAPAIADAIKLADQRQECDVLIVARGGGSREDLWGFNERVVAEAIHHCSCPIITGIGHEIDFTIADFVADQRAPTPSAAAELVSPDRGHLQQKVDRLAERLQRAMQQQQLRLRQQLEAISARLQSPQQQLYQLSQRLDNLELRLKKSIQQNLALKQHQFGRLVRTLDAISPLATLQRGFAIVTNTDKHLITSIHEVQPSDVVCIRLKDGTLQGLVQEQIALESDDTLALKPPNED